MASYFEPSYFDRQAAKSDRKIAWQYDRMLRFAGRQATPGQRVLDLGCGAAPGLRYFASRGVAAVGVDVSRAALAAARCSLPSALLVLIDRAEALPFPAASFDIAILSEIVEHLPASEPVLRECRRVLRPGGVVLITTPNLWDARRFIAYLGGSTWSGYRDATHINLRTPRSLRRDLAAAGFSRVRLTTGWKPLLRFGGRRLPFVVAVPYPPLIGNGILAAGWV